MEYIINNKVVFDTTRRTLSSGDKTFVLSNPASRLLSLLLKNNQRVLTRDNIFQHVWEDYGLPASGNSLNNNISILRRKLSALGLDGIIETIPKQGIQINVEELVFSPSDEEYILDPQSFERPADEKNTSVKTLFRWALPITGLLFLALFITEYHETEKPWRLYDTFNNCSIYYPKSMDVSVVKDYFAMEGVKFLNESCLQRHNIYFNSVDKDERNVILDRFIAKCSYGKNGRINECKNYVEVKIN